MKKEMERMPFIFGQNIAWLRRKNKMTQKEMAAIMGVGIKSLVRVEKGELPPRMAVDVLVNLSQAFGLPIVALFLPRE